jgi:carboxymethylenebutenolidase
MIEGRPSIPPPGSHDYIEVMSDSLSATTVQIAGSGGDQIAAYVARPDSGDRRGGVIVIHHMPGYDRATKEIVRRFAEMGYDAICPNLHWREAPGAAPDDAAATVRARGGVPDERLVGDTAGAAAYLRSLPTANGKVGVIGYCSGGRQSVLVACTVDVDAAVDCYGAFVTGTPPEGFPMRKNLVDQLPNLRAPCSAYSGPRTRRPARSTSRSSRRSSPRTARRSSSIRTPTRATRSSRSTGRRTGLPRPTTVGRGSPRSSART